FLNIPTFAGFLAFGFLLVGALFRFRSGRFGVEDNWLVYLVLCGYTVGLLPTTSSRMLQNTFYALGDTRAPARIAVARVVFSAAMGYPLMRWLDGIPVAAVSGTGGVLRLGAVGLALASGLASWLELLLLRRALARSAPGPVVPWRDLGRMMLLALAAAVPAALVWWALPPLHVALQALAVVGVYAPGYLLLARLTGAEELGFWLGRFGGRLRR
ncbi:MAG TPA: lipid II flippase MurJ, partial [Thermoanaerobaculia bacterium]